MTLSKNPETVLSPVDIPEREQSEIVELYRRSLLSGAQAQLLDPAGKSLAIPKPVYNLLVQILKDLAEGSSVAILQDRQGLTTAEGSRLLGISRQFFVNLLEKGEIPHHKVGTHRRVYIKDLLSYKCRRDRARRAVLNQMAESELEAGVYDVIPNDSLANDFTLLLDTCAVVPISLCDLLLRLAEEPALYRPKWSEEILGELSGVLRREPFSLSEARIEYRLACMRSAFPEAMVSEYEPLSESMPINPKDRHVLAAAVYCKADAILTLNRRDFPVDILRRFGLERLTPDEFLVHQWHLDAASVRQRVAEQAIEWGKEMASHLALLERMVPSFANLCRRKTPETE